MKVVKFIKLLAVLLLTLNLFLFVVVVADFTKILLSAKSIGNSNLMYFFVSKFAGLLKNCENSLIYNNLLREELLCQFFVARVSL